METVVDSADERVSSLPQSVDQAKTVVLTYETLYEMLRREKDRAELQELPANFLADTLAYLRDKHDMLEAARNKTDIFSADERLKLQRQIDSIRAVLRDLYNRRERKIVDMSLTSSRVGGAHIDTKSLLPEERSLFDSVSECLSKMRSSVLHALLELKLPVMTMTQTIAPARTTRHVKFTQQVPAFVGSELESYGPFESGDAHYLPTEIAEILVSQGSAVLLDE